MRWDNGVRFAFTPRVCDCGHTVWLEKYYYLGYKDVPFAFIPIYKCKECYKQENKNENS